MDSSIVKKIVLIIVFISSVSFLFANRPFGNPKFYVDARIGLGTSSINGVFPYETKSFSNGKLGLVALYRIKTNYMIESGLGISNFTIANKETKYRTYRARYYQVPLLFRTLVYKKLSVGIGGTYHFLRDATEFNYIVDGEDIDITNQLRNNFPSATISLQLGDQGVYLGCVYDYGLDNMRLDANKWGATSFRVYLQMNISEIIKQRAFR
jgi:hypothetical protein